jgi:hypothetical protein
MESEMKKCLCLVAIMPIVLLTMPVAQAAGEDLAMIATAASMAQKQCNLMHNDADEYVACVDALGQEVKGKANLAQYQRLGIAYFGWVGAVHWGRVGLPGADEAAQRYFLRFRPLQKQLKLSDEALCSTVPGDCKVRLAQLVMAQREYLPAKEGKAGSKASKSIN